MQNMLLGDVFGRFSGSLQLDALQLSMILKSAS